MSLYAILHAKYGHVGGYDISDHLATVNTLHVNSSQMAKDLVNLHAIEEMAELTQEIVKIHVRGKTDREDAYYEEMADVIILLDQAISFMNYRKLHDAIIMKIDRFKTKYEDGRIDNGTN
jgi:hypothetical protein